MILINGNFLCRNLTGIERFSFEVCKRLDAIADNNCNIAILVPANAKQTPEYKNIKVIATDITISSFPRWDLIDFAKYCKKMKAVPLNFSNTAPLGKNCGIAFIHDIYAYDYKTDFKNFRDRLVSLYSCFNYRNIAKNAKKIVTVSNFSKNRIIKAYKAPSHKIEVIGNGWDHFKDVTIDESIFDNTPSITKYSYYFTLGSISKRKNLAWIAEYAQEHPNSTFVISGKAIRGLVPPELKKLQNLSNVILAGYVTDEQVKALMTYCKAFIFPSYYEGFGIPPLEALSCGAKVFCADSSCLKEIYKDTVHYINPVSTNVNLDQQLLESVSTPDAVLKKYTYDNAAQKLYNLIKMF